MNGEQLLKIADAGLLLTLHENESELLGVLLNIEDILDQGRGLAFDTPELKSEINAKMDMVRKRIRDILENMDKDTAKQFLYNRGERLKNQFSI